MRVFPKVAAWKVRAVFYGALFALLVSFVAFCTWMPGGSAEKASVGNPSVARALKEDVSALVALGPRNLDHPRAYETARIHLEKRLAEASGRELRREKVEAHQGEAFNLLVEWGAPLDEPLVVVGAHYDTAPDTPGGNDNGTGVAVALELARRFRKAPPSGSLRIVLFANEEPPHFWSESMGSLVHAKGCKKRGENVVGMLALETMGFYSQAPESQKYPAPFGLLYPSKGNFIAFVGNLGSRALVSRSILVFREAVDFPSEGGAFPGGLPGIGWSDHWSFWQVGYPGIMVTDTAPFRDHHYHRVSDGVEHIDFSKLSVVTEGVEAVVRDLVDGVDSDR